MGRYGMLDCRSNFSMGSGAKMCSVCNVIDDEMHRMNDCKKYRYVNWYESNEKIDFERIYLGEMGDVLHVVDAILKVWDLEHGRIEYGMLPPLPHFYLN